MSDDLFSSFTLLHYPFKRKASNSCSVFSKSDVFERGKCSHCLAGLRGEETELAGASVTAGEVDPAQLKVEWDKEEEEEEEEELVFELLRVKGQLRVAGTVEEEEEEDSDDEWLPGMIAKCPKSNAKG
jgi:hypothetical protein